MKTGDGGGGERLCFCTLDSDKSIIGTGHGRRVC